MFTRSTLLALSLVLTAGPALAHERGVLHLGKKEVETRSHLELRGEHLPKNATITLQLRGTLATFALGEVKTDSAGGFSARPGLPQEARAGAYTVTAVAADGDKVAEAALVIVAAQPPDHEMAKYGAANTSPSAAESPHARPDMMELSTSTTGMEWALILGLVGASLVGGAILLRNPAER
ncbi:MAG TPA: hypothetical protein VI383_11965 [Gemmatimonadales bacterium]|nr:hypothetical protein [Gemmatimonadales bacterium]